MLPEGRPVLAQTEGTRKKLLEAFDAWLRDKQLSVAAVVSSGTDVEELVKLLNDYGRELFSAGYPYYLFSETINGIASKAVTGRLGPCLCVALY